MITIVSGLRIVTLMIDQPTGDSARQRGIAPGAGLDHQIAELGRAMVHGIDQDQLRARLSRLSQQRDQVNTADAHVLAPQDDRATVPQSRTGRCCH